MAFITEKNGDQILELFRFCKNWFALKNPDSRLQIIFRLACIDL